MFQNAMQLSCKQPMKHRIKLNFITEVPVTPNYCNFDSVYFYSKLLYTSKVAGNIQWLPIQLIENTYTFIFKLIPVSITGNNTLENSDVEEHIGCNVNVF